MDFREIKFKFIKILDHMDDVHAPLAVAHAATTKKKNAKKIVFTGIRIPIFWRSLSGLRWMRKFSNYSRNHIDSGISHNGALYIAQCI